MSFSSLLAVHEQLNELFLQHQEALLRSDIETAQQRLREYERELLAHMQVEEELLLPVYERAGRIAGGPVEFFTGEHRRMREFLQRFAAALEAMKEAMKKDPAELSRRIIRLFDEEATCKQLAEHHDARERNIFFPALDRVTGEEERSELLKRCLSVNFIHE
ncbi:MAG TPA: hemerythrin domain-containing protein [Blastocatellia bacterium]|nr:hemerythrin domain-containing protein [Blastocatellia bacterium]